MDGRHKPDKSCRVGHGSDEERQDRAKGAETERDPEKAAVQQTDDDVIAQMSANEEFDFGERQHYLILPSDPDSSLQDPNLIFPLTEFPKYVK